MDIPEVSTQDVPDDAVLLDVREQDEWDAGHAPGAVHIPLSDLPQRLGELPETDAAVLPVVCRSGGRSAQAVAWLSQQGFEVANVVGGMRAWSSSGKPMAARQGDPRVL